MSKCRYDLSEDCHNKDCLACVLDKIRAEIEAARFIDKDTKLCKNANASGLEVALEIIDKHLREVTTDADRD